MEEYRSEMDILSGFFHEKCEFQPQARVNAGLIYQEYEKWCREMGENPISQKMFGLRLKEKGCLQIRIGKTCVRAWNGIGFIAN